MNQYLKEEKKMDLDIISDISSNCESIFGKNDGFKFCVQNSKNNK